MSGNINRRKLLKTSLAGVATSTLGLGTFADIAEASHSEWTDGAYDTDSLQNMRIDHGYGLTYIGTYTQSHDEIVHDFELSNCAESRVDYGFGWEYTPPEDSFNSHNVYLNANFDDQAVWDTDDSSGLAAMPSSESIDVTPALEIIEVALSNIPGLGQAMDARTVADALLFDNPGDQDPSPNTRDFTWSYLNSTESYDISNYYNFGVKMLDNCEDAYFELESRTYNSAVGSTYVRKTYTVPTIDCGGITPSSTSTRTTTRDSNWERVPASEIAASARLQQIRKELGGGKLYRAFADVQVEEEITGSENDPRR